MYYGELSKEKYDYSKKPKKEVSKLEQANLISSETNHHTHMPVLDLDFPCELVASSTPGHFHLYMNKEISFGRYYDIVYDMVKAKLLEEGILEQMKLYHATFVRPPHVKK